MKLDEDKLNTKIAEHDQIYKFIDDNTLIWDCLGAQIFAIQALTSITNIFCLFIIYGRPWETHL